MHSTISSLSSNTLWQLKQITQPEVRDRNVNMWRDQVHRFFPLVEQTCAEVWRGRQSTVILSGDDFWSQLFLFYSRWMFLLGDLKLNTLPARPNTKIWEMWIEFISMNTVFEFEHDSPQLTEANVKQHTVTE